MEASRADLEPHEFNAISGEIVDAAIEVHSALGPGLLESAYLACLAHELRSRGMRIETQVPLPVIYKGMNVGVAYRLDLVAEQAVIVDTKSVKTLHPLHEAQLLSYLKLSNRRVGLLLNFNVVHMRHGIKRIVNKF